ncbi:MAG: FAD-dependent oxidoreductase [Veillonella sp.]|nr:FAD-dependent oxidoreductase [Veillonella sp.]
MIYDLAIVGGGPAGLSAAITARLRGQQVILFEGGNHSEKLRQAWRIDNYPGLPEISGEELMNRFLAQAKSLGAEIVYKKVQNVFPGEPATLMIGDDVVQAKAVILATGAVIGQVIPGEDRLLGRGVSYCATCDGNFFAGKRVAVYIDTVAEWDDVEFLAAVASSVDVFCRADVAETLPSALPEKVTLHDGVKILEILGDSSVSEINTSRGTFSVDGVFLLRAVLPPTHVVDGLTVEDNHIKVDSWGATNLPGIFSAGDVTGNPLQIAKAVGDGQTAALAAVAYNSSKKAAR